MEEKELEPELTPNQIRGLDLCVNGLRRKYNFVTGWEPLVDYRKYDNTLFIILKIDYDKLSDFYGFNIRPVMKNYIDLKEPDWWGRDLYSLLGYMDLPEGVDPSYDIKKQMNDRINLLYENLPEEYQRTWTQEYTFSVQTYPVNINIMSFKVY